MAKFLIILYRIINLYLYYVVMACLLSLLPYINPNYPLFNAIFKSAGFYLIPPVFGFIIGPAVILVGLALLSNFIEKYYNEHYAKNKPKIVVLTPEQFMRAMENKDEFIKSLEESEEEKNDRN